MGSNGEVKDWEYDDSFYGGEGEKKVRTFEEIAAECAELMDAPDSGSESCDNSKLVEMADNVGRIKKLSSEGADLHSIAKELKLDDSFVSDVLITISGSPEDDSDMAIAYLIMMN